MTSPKERLPAELRQLPMWTQSGRAPRQEQASLDKDLDTMSREELLHTAHAMRQDIRAHQQASGHRLCWYWPELWRHLPENAQAMPEVPPRDEFLRRCVEYHQSLEEQCPTNGPSETTQKI